ncbi:MAG TPA: M23 family metallopeptidase [Virgibacillus sp.]|nr:M23 family metallopeptidase [Virgibacillus sp.]
MKEENKGASKNTWRRIIQKKWFFPSLYLMIAALLLTGVVWFQNTNQTPDAQDEENLEATNDLTSPYDEDAQSVMEQQEVIKMPVADEEEAEIVTKFYDYNADQEDQESALILYNNRYYQSTGIDIATADGEEFDVVASLSGTVTEVKEDPILGNVVTLSHDNDVMTYYASLGEVDVKAGDELEQGDFIGTAGKNLFGKDNGIHVHFELRKDGQEINPEEFFNQPVSKLEEHLQDEEEKEVTEETEETEDNEIDSDEEESDDVETGIDEDLNEEDEPEADEDENDE